MAEIGGRTSDELMKATPEQVLAAGGVSKRRRNLSNKSGADKVRNPHSKSPKRRAGTPEPEKRIFTDESEKEGSDDQEVRRRVRTFSEKQSTGSQTGRNSTKMENDEEIDDFEMIKSMHKLKQAEEEKEEERRKAEVFVHTKAKEEMKREVKEKEMPPLIIGPPPELRKRRPNTLPLQKSFDSLEKPAAVPRAKSKTRSHSASRKLSTSEEDEEFPGTKLTVKGKLTLRPKPAVEKAEVSPELKKRKDARPKKTEKPIRKKKKELEESEDKTEIGSEESPQEGAEEVPKEETKIVEEKTPWFFQRWFSTEKKKDEVEDEKKKGERKSEEPELLEIPEPEAEPVKQVEVVEEPEVRDEEVAEVSPVAAIEEEEQKIEKKRLGKELFREWKLFVAEHPEQYEILRGYKNYCISSLILIIIYCGFGAFIFRFTEGAFESFYKCGVKRVKRDFIDSLWSSSTYMREDDWKSLARRKLMEFENQLHTAHEAGMTTYSGQRSWSFINSILYCLTVITTIGYGHISPSTTTGRVITIIYAIVGIPIFLILLADFGKLLTRGIKFLWAFVRRLYYTGSCKKVRRTAPVQEVMKGVQIMYDFAKNRRPSQLPPGVVEELRQQEEALSAATAAQQTTETPDTPAPSTFEIDDEFNLPISLAITILIIYMLVGATICMIWEEWGFFESFYFVFISMSTIGFGDFVPQHEMYMMASIVYLVFGLALTSMCINVFQESLRDTFRQASAKIGATIGLRMAEEGQQQQQTQQDETVEDNTTLNADNS